MLQQHDHRQQMQRQAEIPSRTFPTSRDYPVQQCASCMNHNSAPCHEDCMVPLSRIPSCCFETPRENPDNCAVYVDHINASGCQQCHTMALQQMPRCTCQSNNGQLKQGEGLAPLWLARSKHGRLLICTDVRSKSCRLFSTVCNASVPSY
eukprot:GEMP01073314.1.p2 GENE.GEMP01073314.1~~GEMP01073314.1.p2  ORF type:complete len:150 (+),score=19.04 GEMP01073314.1:381-830(+)